MTEQHDSPYAEDRKIANAVAKGRAAMERIRRDPYIPRAMPVHKTPLIIEANRSRPLTRDAIREVMAAREDARRQEQAQEERDR